MTLGIVKICKKSPFNHSSEDKGIYYPTITIEDLQWIITLYTHSKSYTLTKHNVTIKLFITLNE